MKKLTVIVMLVAAVLLFTPPLLGMRAQQQLENGLDRSTQQSAGNFAVQLQDYQRGWFSSQGNIRITLSDDYIASLKRRDPALQLLKMLNQGIMQSITVAHGPLLVGDTVDLGVGELVTTIDAASHPRLRRVLEATGNRYIARATLTMGFAGTSDLHIDAPPFQYINDNPASRVVFGGGAATGTLDLDGMQIVLAGQMEGFSLTADGGELVVERTEFDADVSYPESDPYGLGSGRVSVQRAIALSNDQTALHVQDAQMEFSSSRNDRALVDVSMSYTTQALTTADTEFTDFKLGLRMTNLDGNALTRLQSVQFDLAGASDMHEISKALRDPAYDLLSASPVLHVEPVEFALGGQPFSAKLSVSTRAQDLPPRTAFDIADSLMYANVFDVQAELSLHKNLAMEAAVPQLKAQLAAGAPQGVMVDDPQLDAMARAQAPMLLGSLIGQGLIVEDGDQYRVQASYSQGQLRVNGNPFPIAALFGAGLAPQN